MALPRIKKTAPLDRTNIYRDFSMTFEKNPVTNDVSMKSDVYAVKESMKNILLTDRGSRLFNPLFGGSIRSYLFENKYSETLNKIIEKEVITTINTYEPRAVIDSVECVSSQDDNHLYITIYFYVQNVAEMQTTTITMEKIR